MESSGGIADYTDRRGDSDVQSGFSGALGDAAFGDWVVDLLELKEVSSHLEGVDFVCNRASGNDKGVFKNCSGVEDIDTNVSLIKRSNFTLEFSLGVTEIEHGISIDFEFEGVFGSICCGVEDINTSTSIVGSCNQVVSDSITLAGSGTFHGDAGSQNDVGGIVDQSIHNKFYIERVVINLEYSLVYSVGGNSSEFLGNSSQKVN